MKKMNKKIKYGAAAVCGALAIMLLVSAGTGGFQMGRSMEILVNMFREISLFYVDEVDSEKMLADAAAGMTSSLDPYTEYISEEAMELFTQMTTGKYGGIGSLIREKDGYVVFAQPYKNSPADKAGIEIGDYIVEIDGKDAGGMTTSQVSNTLKGEPGTYVKLKVKKFYTGETESVRIKREIISVPGIPYYGMIDGNIGYIHHADFTEDCSNDMRNAVMQLKQQGAESLILDYRSNGGGIMQEAVKILSFFLPKGTEVVSMRGRGPEMSSVFLTQNEPLDIEIPIVVLTDGHSASAAEIMAGALQDLDRAVIMGRRTFGKGLVQSTRALDYNSYLKMTTAKYYLPSGRCIQAIDYARRDEDGRISYVPDSLVKEYHTANLRKVYDGGGIIPDVKLEAEYVSRFAYLLYGKNYISDYADVLARKYHGTPVIPGEFKLSDEDYEGFVAYMEDKDTGWESDTKRALELLKLRATQERYIDSVKDDIAAIETKLSDDKATNLVLHRKELTELIENELVLRHNYAWGVSLHNIGNDKDITAAVELLGDKERYDAILTSRDTERK